MTVKLNKDQFNKCMETKDKLMIESKSWIGQVILYYFSILCLIDAYLLSLHIGTIFTRFEFATVGAAFFFDNLYLHINNKCQLLDKEKIWHL